MGWNFRKSVSIGPFRVTASQSGLSYSVGGKGLRVTRQADGRTRTTVSLPGTGISYSETAPAKAPRPARKERVQLCFDPELLPKKTLQKTKTEKLPKGKTKPLLYANTGAAGGIHLLES